MRLHKPKQHTQKCGFAAAGGTDERGKLAGGNGQVHAGENLAAVFIAKRHIAECDFRCFAAVRNGGGSSVFAGFFSGKIEHGDDSAGGNRCRNYGRNRAD